MPGDVQKIVCYFITFEIEVEVLKNDCTKTLMFWTFNNS